MHQKFRAWLLLSAGSFSFSPWVLAADTTEQQVDQIFSAYQKADSPGCALGVIRDGNFIYKKGYGTASLELSVPLTPQSVFYMGSVSKQFTAASVVLAAQKGLLSLDDDVHKYIPELPDYGAPITLRQMLNHTSGLRDWLTLLSLAGRDQADVHTAPEILELIVHQKGLNFKPGDEYLYSNTNYFLLAEIIKRVTRQPLSTFAAENIFRPLGMTHTRFYDNRTDVLPGRVPAYAPGSNGTFLVDWSTNFDTVGSGGLMSDVDDLLYWDRNFYDDKLGNRNLVNELETRGFLNNGKQLDYAMGLILTKYRGVPVVEHDGANFGYRTDIIRFPEQHFTVICLCNVASAEPDALARRVADVYLDSQLNGMPHSADSSVAAPLSISVDLGPYVGMYETTRHSIFSLVANDGQLTRTPFRRSARPVSDGHFVGDEMDLVFEGKGQQMRVVTTEIDGPTTIATRVFPPRLSEAELAQFAGAYTSPELEAEYKLSVEQGKLVLHQGRRPGLSLSPVKKDEFSGGRITLVFRRGGGGKPSGFELYTGWIGGIAFAREQTAAIGRTLS